MDTNQPTSENITTTAASQVPDGQLPSQQPTGPEMLALAQRYLASGLSLVPIACDGSKLPATQLLPETHQANGATRRGWKVFQSRQPTIDEVQSWFYHLGTPPGLAIVCGAISGGLEVIDFDDADLANPWIEFVEEQNSDLVNRLVMVLTPRPGVHMYFRSPACAGNNQLAQKYQLNPATGNQEIKTLIETRGEGGFVIAAGSPGYCHPSGQEYILCHHDFSEIPIITPEDRTLLFDAARRFNEIRQSPPAVFRSAMPDRSSNLEQPGDDFNASGNWGQILRSHGWEFVWADEQGREGWRRPGKDFGIGATVNYAGNNRLHVFSTNVPGLDAGQSYSKFDFVTRVVHGGDYSAAARALRAMGFGQQWPYVRRRRN